MHQQDLHKDDQAEFRGKVVCLLGLQFLADKLFYLCKRHILYRYLQEVRLSDRHQRLLSCGYLPGLQKHNAVFESYLHESPEDCGGSEFEPEQQDLTVRTQGCFV